MKSGRITYFFIAVFLLPLFLFNARPIVTPHKSSLEQPVIIPFASIKYQPLEIIDNQNKTNGIKTQTEITPNPSGNNIVSNISYFQGITSTQKYQQDLLKVEENIKYQQDLLKRVEGIKKQQEFLDNLQIQPTLGDFEFRKQQEMLDNFNTFQTQPEGYKWQYLLDDLEGLEDFRNSKELLDNLNQLQELQGMLDQQRQLQVISDQLQTVTDLYREGEMRRQVELAGERLIAFLADTEQRRALVEQATFAPASLNPDLLAADQLMSIAQAYQLQGRLGQALIKYKQAYEKAAYSTEKMFALNGITRIYLVQGRNQEALEVLDQTRILIPHAIAEERSGHGLASGAFELWSAQDGYSSYLREAEELTWLNEGDIHFAQKDYNKALDAYWQAQNINQTRGPWSKTGAALTKIGRVYHSQRKYKEAMARYQEALAIERQSAESTSVGVGNILVDDRYILIEIGRLYTDQERYPEALDTYQQALPKVENPVEAGMILGGMGEIYQAQKHDFEALIYYQQTMNLLELVRTAAGSDQGRAGFIAQHADLYSHAVNFFHRQGWDEEAFLTSERGRTRAFLDSLATGRTTFDDEVAAAFLTQSQSGYHQKVQKAIAQASDPTLLALLENQSVEDENAYATALADIQAYSRLPSSLTSQREAVLDLSEVQRLLNEQTTLVSFFVLDDKTLAFVITQHNFEVIELRISRQELTELVRDFHQVLGKFEPVVTQSVTQALYQVLIAPLIPYFQTPHLLIIPHNSLHYLPFAALQNPDTNRYLIQDYTVTFLPSASTLPFIQDNAYNANHSSGLPLILGNPITENPNLPLLPAAEREAETIANLQGTQPLLGEFATESAVREQVGRSNIVHIAAHGLYNNINPLYSAIALTPDKVNDGILEVHEIYNLDLYRTELVVLSACETQLGEPGSNGELIGVSNGDEIVGLTRAFFFSGTPTVIASLWNVDDNATAMLMEHFYTHLDTGMSKAEALRQAQLDLIEDGEYGDPFYWSAFVLSGSAGDEKFGFRIWGWLFLGSGTLAIITTVVIPRRRSTRA